MWMNVTSRDLRYNYFDNCSTCCLTSMCSPPCVTHPIRNVSFTSPPNVITSTWLEKRAYVLGSPVTIIEVETRFVTQPHIIQSVACPYTPCQSSNSSSFRTGKMEDEIEFYREVHGQQLNALLPFSLLIPDHCRSYLVWRRRKRELRLNVR